MTTTTNTAPLDPTAFDSLLHAAEVEATSLQSEVADVYVKLAGAPADDQLHELAAQLEGEISTVQVRHKRLLDARSEATRRFTVAAQREYLVTQVESRNQIAVMGADMWKIGMDVFAHLIKLRPQLDALVSLGAERAKLAADLMPSAGPASNREARQSVLEMATGSRSVLVDVMHAGLRQSGFGLPGPAGGVAVPPAPVYPGRTGVIGQGADRLCVGPDTSHAWHKSEADVCALAQTDWKRSESNLLHMLDTARTAARARLSIDDDSESVATDIA